MEKILSVSVAAYNVEKFIEQNMKSFLNTNVSDKIEVLIIDDGSKDKTAEIASKYQQEYPETVRLIQQKNSGPGATVNTGLYNATGKYFRMVDGDDWVNSDDLDKYITFLENNVVDVVFTDYCLVDNDTNEQVPQIISFDRKNQILDYDEICQKIDVSMHNVTYLTEVLKNHQIKLDNCFYTDMEYLLYPVSYLNSAVVLDCLIYMYRVSLSTQSMNINSMIRNKKMHETVFHHLLDDFAYKLSENELTKSKIDFIRMRLLIMAGAQLSIIIAQKPSEESKNELKLFTNYIFSRDTVLYDSFISLKTMKVILKSHYLLFNLISIIHRNRVGIDK